MNTETGQIYHGEPAIQQAKERGEPIVPVSDRVARLMEEALTREARRLEEARRLAWRERWLRPKPDPTQ